MYASRRNSEGCLQLLLNAGAHVEAQDESGSTALIGATR